MVSWCLYTNYKDAVCCQKRNLTALQWGYPILETALLINEVALKPKELGLKPSEGEKSIGGFCAKASVSSGPEMT